MTFWLSTFATCSLHYVELFSDRILALGELSPCNLERLLDCLFLLKVCGPVHFHQCSVDVCCVPLIEVHEQVKDRAIVAKRMREHVQAPDTTPLLIFPEGTCVNNEYCVMFKRGAFDLGATVCPVAIKYNKVFVDAFWNSKRQSFTAHLVSISLRALHHNCEPEYHWASDCQQRFFSTPFWEYHQASDCRQRFFSAALQDFVTPRHRL